MKRYLPALIFVSVSAIGLAMTAASWFSVAQANRISFEASADEAVRRITDRINTHMLLIRSTGSYFRAIRQIPEHAAFRRYIEGLRVDDDFGGVQGIGFARFIPATASAEAEVADEIASGYGRRIVPWPETSEAVRTPIVRLGPDNPRNAGALGYDMYSNSVRREAMDAAIATGRMQATGRVDLVQENTLNDRQAGFLIYLPFYDTSMPVVQSTPSGFVYAAFRTGDLLRAALDHSPLLPVHVEIRDETASEDAVLYRSADELAGYAEEFAVEQDIRVAGRNWMITIKPSAAHRLAIDQSRTFILGIISLLLAAALMLSTLAQQRTMEAVQTLQRETEKNLAERDFLLQEMKHRIKNLIARVLAMARQTARNTQSIDQFTQSYTARLEAMAASQDLLARSSWTSAALRDLLVQELRQVFGEDLDEERLSGPPVELNETAAQAFGLTFHELATNALKYGYIRAEGGMLSVDWKLTGSGREGRQLELEWRETSTGSIIEGIGTEGTGGKGGFGSRLIDASMRIELGGEVVREKGPKLWYVKITVPAHRIIAKDQAAEARQTVRSRRVHPRQVADPSLAGDEGTESH